jgi:hypothetical protein
MYAVGHQGLCVLPGMFYIANMYVGFTVSFSALVLKSSVFCYVMKENIILLSCL